MATAKLIYKTKGEAQEYAYLGLNHYVGCSHGCGYCYMRTMYQRYKMGDFDKPRPRMEPEALLAQLEKEAAKLAGIKQRVQLCFSTDPYQPIDDDLRLTRKVIQVLRKYNIPFQVLTKGLKHAITDFELYGKNDLFGVTLTSLTPLSKLETKAAEPIERIGLLKCAHDIRIKTWVSLEPVIWPAETLRIIEATYEFVDLYKIGKMNHGGGSEHNWQKFAGEAVALCDRLGVKYYLKQNLAALLDKDSYHNTDWRVVS